MTCGCKPQGEEMEASGSPGLVSLAYLVSPKQMREPVSKKGGQVALQERHRRVSASAHLAHLQAFKKNTELLWKLSSLHLRKVSAPFSLLSLTLFLPQIQIKPTQKSRPPLPPGAAKVAVSRGERAEPTLGCWSSLPPAHPSSRPLPAHSIPYLFCPDITTL